MSGIFLENPYLRVYFSGDGKNLIIIHDCQFVVKTPSFWTHDVFINMSNKMSEFGHAL